MKVLIVLALVAFAACDADQPKNQLDMVKDAFWDYITKTTLATEETLEMVKRSELGQEVSTSILQSADAMNQFTEALRTRVTPLTQELMATVSHKSQRLKLHLEKLALMNAQLQPYAEDVKADLQRQVEELRRVMTPYADTLDHEALRAALLQKGEALKENLGQSVGPYAEELRQRMEQSVVEFQESLIPIKESFQAELVQKAQKIQQELTPYGEDLKAKLDVNAQELKHLLAALWDSFTNVSL